MRGVSVWISLMLLGSSISFDPDSLHGNEHDFIGTFDDVSDSEQDDAIRKFNQDDYIAICADQKTLVVESPLVLQECSPSILSTSLALSLLRHSSTPSESFVFSPFSLGTALSILNDGANGETQRQLTNLLLPGCTPDDVTNHYSSLAFSHPARNNDTSFTSSNRFYIDNTVELKHEYIDSVKKDYGVEVESIDLREKEAAADRMNDFVKTATNGEIKELIDATQISNKTLSYLINAVHFNGLWQDGFMPSFGNMSVFKGVNGDRHMKFMDNTFMDNKFHLVNEDNKLGTAVVLPYKDSNFQFFMLMPNESMSFEQMRTDLTGEKLMEIISDAKRTAVKLTMPKFELDSTLNSIETLRKLGVTDLNQFSKISDIPLKVSDIMHKATIKVAEKGTIATAATGVVGNLLLSRRHLLARTLIFDRPFLFGIVKNEAILFMGQFV